MLSVLTAAEMREVDRRTVELGIPGIVLMENAGARVVEFLQRRFHPLAEHRIVIFCGKGNNGGDALVVARQLFTRFQPRALNVILTADPETMTGDAAQNFRMLTACGCPFVREFTPEMSAATLVIDGLLGTGLKGPASGKAQEHIRRINSSFPAATVVSIDIPSGLPSDAGTSTDPAPDFVRAGYTITFTALKPAHALSPACHSMGEVTLAQIGSPSHLFNTTPLAQVDPAALRPLFAPRKRDANKGTYGHVLLIAGSRGRTGAAAMSGLSALRAGAGLSTVASAASAIPLIAGHAPELMTDALPETAAGDLAASAFDAIAKLAKHKTVIGMGPGLGTEPETVSLVRRLFHESELPLVADADALNGLAGSDWSGKGHFRAITPHPGEMARLTGKSIAEVQADRLGAAGTLARERDVIVVLKGERTLIAFPDGRIWINPTGSPAMSTGGTGDILTGLVCGMLAQFHDRRELAIAAAVYLHGLAGEIGASHLTESSLIATDLLRFLPDAIHALTSLPHPL